MRTKGAEDWVRERVIDLDSRYLGYWTRVYVVCTSKKESVFVT